ncbi:hypothetical protein V5O48_012438 [Marasmius crinis-equi]|uniref:Uncharacterized protein n=1 Tax=Marasmius crinis-equi TaxID=585013 RepID=A0ABR3F2R6_9AGAR
MVRIDDTSPRLVYTPPDAWFLGGTESEWNFTTHGTRSAGAEMKFVFTGTGIDVYGTISFNQSTVSVSNTFSLDDKNPVTWSASVHSGPVYNTTMFSAQGLEDRMHTLVMQVKVENSETWIDYLEVTSSEAFSGSQPPTLSTATPSLSSAPTQPPPTQAASDRGHVLSAGAIVGITFSGTLAVVMALLCLVWWIRRKRGSNEDMGAEGRAHVDRE